MKSSSPFSNSELAKLIEMLQSSDFEKGKCIMPGVYEVEMEKGSLIKSVRWYFVPMRLL